MSIDHYDLRMHVEASVFFDHDASLFNSTDPAAIAIACRATRGRENYLDFDASLSGIDQCLFNIAILHLLRFDLQHAVGVIDQRRKVITRIDRADDEIGVVKLCSGAIPIGIKDILGGLDILLIGIDDAVFAIGHAACATEGRACKVRGHDIDNLSVNDHALFMRYGKIGTGLLRFDASGSQAIKCLLWRTALIGMNFEHHAYVKAPMRGIL